MRDRRIPMMAIIMGLCLCLIGLQVNAGKVRKIVLQISDGSPQKQAMVLNVAGNLVRHYGIDNLKIEIVAFGPGLRLLFKNNANKERVQSLNTYGVRFSACQNTVKAMTGILGHAPVLNKHSVPVTAGVVRITELVDRGYILVRP